MLSRSHLPKFVDAVLLFENHPPPLLLCKQCPVQTAPAAVCIILWNRVVDGSICLLSGVSFSNRTHACTTPGMVSCRLATRQRLWEGKRYSAWIQPRDETLRTYDVNWSEDFACLDIVRCMGCHKADCVCVCVCVCPCVRVRACVCVCVLPEAGSRSLRGLGQDVSFMRVYLVLQKGA